MKVLFANPAYGRTYQSSRTIEFAWKDGKDFKVEGGPYFSIRDVDKLKDSGYDRVLITCGDLIFTAVIAEEVMA